MEMQERMKVFLTGGTGFIGTRLVTSLVGDGHTCTVVSRSATDPWKSDRVTVVKADPTAPGPWQAHVGEADIVVNLAGAKIVDPPLRWTRRRKALLSASRIGTTTCVVEAIRAAASPPHVFLTGSAIGYYGPRGNETIEEHERSGSDFLATLAVDWEAAAAPASDKSRVVTMRMGLPLSPGGGILQPMLPLFRAGLGGPWGNASSWLSWIHLDDTIGLMRFLMESEVDGPANITAPTPVTVRNFATELGRVLHRPAVIPAPGVALRLALGESADALLHLQRVVPRRALDAGYEFRFPTLKPALEDLFRK